MAEIWLMTYEIANQVAWEDHWRFSFRILDMAACDKIIVSSDGCVKHDLHCFC